MLRVAVERIHYLRGNKLSFRSLSSWLAPRLRKNSTLSQKYSRTGVFLDGFGEVRDLHGQ
jgi:hypothetical protein